ncbi:hypothetical protein F4604DRAFT_930417 [Suillus subluteus]|nr:hypothetical protein F4604DRAFT_930417 [Suillus subluteus]
MPSLAHLSYCLSCKLRDSQKRAKLIQLPVIHLIRPGERGKVVCETQDPIPQSECHARLEGAIEEGDLECTQISDTDQIIVAFSLVEILYRAFLTHCKVPRLGGVLGQISFGDIMRIQSSCKGRLVCSSRPAITSRDCKRCTMHPPLDVSRMLS